MVLSCIYIFYLYGNFHQETSGYAILYKSFLYNTLRPGAFVVMNITG
jgi:hypothetical protein